MARYFMLYYNKLEVKKMINKNLLSLSILAIIFGSIYTIFRKYQSCAQLSDPDKIFNQPLYK